jgi:hypothetical protein
VGLLAGELMRRASDEVEKHGGTVPPSNDACRRVTEGSKAWTRLKHNTLQNWIDWLLVGAALLVGRREAMRIACSNRPVGGRYRRAFTWWLRENGFADLEKRTRADLLRIMECVEQIEVWRAGLDKEDRLRINHPTTIWRRWSASKQGTTSRGRSRTEQYKEQVRRLQEENDNLRLKLERLFAGCIDRVKLAKILGMLGSSQEGEVLNAARAAEEMRQRASLTWEDLLGIG